jgi:hypothetical protein
LNQILTNELDADGPFKAESGNKSITQNFQFVEPVSLDYLSQKHGIDLTVPNEKNPDIIFIDCTGTKFDKAIFALNQISAINVIVSSSVVKPDDLDDIRFKIVCPKVLCNSLLKMKSRLYLMQRDIKPRFKRGESFSDGSVQFEQRRIKTDEETLKTVSNLFKEHQIEVQSEIFRAVTQPDFHDFPISYHNTLNEFLQFVKTTALQNSPIFGEDFVFMFNEMLKFINTFPQLNSQNVPFEEIVSNIVDRRC